MKGSWWECQGPRRQPQPVTWSFYTASLLVYFCPLLGKRLPGHWHRLTYSAGLAEVSVPQGAPPRLELTFLPSFSSSTYAQPCYGHPWLAWVSCLPVTKWSLQQFTGITTSHHTRKHSGKTIKSGEKEEKEGRKPVCSHLIKAGKERIFLRKMSRTVIGPMSV